ncbi:hypothetical protein ES703_56176 [subsurface metagenome]
MSVEIVTGDCKEAVTGPGSARVNTDTSEETLLGARRSWLVCFYYLGEVCYLEFFHFCFLRNSKATFLSLKSNRCVPII